MTYDVPFRHMQAIAPSSLTTITATLHALNRAMEDCRMAGVDPDHDPAIALLARHFATVTADRGDDDILRFACSRPVTELERFPALLTLAVRGIAHDRVAKERFPADGRKAMKALALEIGLSPDSFTISSTPSDPAIAGYVALSSDDISIMLSVGPPHEGNEVQYFAKRGPASGQKLRFAPMRDFVRRTRFAARIRRDLRLDAIVGSPAPFETTAPISAKPSPLRETSHAPHTTGCRSGSHRRRTDRMLRAAPGDLP
ncbi:hypothetical protein [Novosphingobium sp. HR1a]|nr:hypothetical protein [Novosphingobium sp. HR1a]MBF7015432.1 hypothetical protein [Novosphingobium sp. HR1a]